MTEIQTQFIFTTFKLDKEEAEISGIDYTIEVSTKDYFDKHGHMQDGYNEKDYAQLITVMDKYGAVESAESSFECATYTAEEITVKLNNLPNFSYSRKLADFLA